MTHIHWVARQNKLEIPNDEEEVNTREIHKCDGQTHHPDTMVAPLTPKSTRKAKAQNPYVLTSGSVFFNIRTNRCVFEHHQKQI
jgi:hypothetical protein